MNPNVDPVKQELENGKAAAQALVEHVSRMGAAEAALPVMHNGREYVVTVAVASPESHSERV